MMPAALAALPLFALAEPALVTAQYDQCPEVAALYQPATETITVNQPGKEPRKVEVPKLYDRAAQPPLHRAVLALELHTAPLAGQLPPQQGVFEAMQPIAMLDNTWRSAVMRCDLSEVWVVSRGGFANSTRWYGPYKLAELMSARGDAAPQFQ